jgi:hypothetical protein
MTPHCYRSHATGSEANGARNEAHRTFSAAPLGLSLFPLLTQTDAGQIFAVSRDPDLRIASAGTLGATGAEVVPQGFTERFVAGVVAEQRFFQEEALLPLHQSIQLGATRRLSKLLLELLAPTTALVQELVRRWARVELQCEALSLRLRTRQKIRERNFWEFHRARAVAIPGCKT